MGAGDASRSDVERREPVRQSTRGVDRCGLVRRPKARAVDMPVRCRRVDRGWQRAPSRRASAPACSRHRPAGTPFGPLPTLESTQSECSECQVKKFNQAAGETTAKGTGLAESAGKEDPVEL
ncbi:hypothetical protein L6452_47016 [Arctium lappa]|nr:hypothetical protein L6452_47016 [Arctium lappa]